MFDFAKKVIIENRENDDLLYEFTLTELENNIIVKSLWAKAIALSEGNENKIKSLYMQYRVQNIKDQFTKQNIAYSELKRELLFQKIKSIFSEQGEGNSISYETEEEKPKKTYTELDIFFNPSYYTEEEKKKILGDNYYEDEEIVSEKVLEHKPEEEFDDYAERRNLEIQEALNQYKK